MDSSNLDISNSNVCHVSGFDQKQISCINFVVTKALQPYIEPILQPVLKYRDI